MKLNYSMYINITRLCGTQKFVVWDDENTDFGSCFQDLFLVFPAQVLLAVTSAYYLGFQATLWILRTRFQKQILAARFLAVLLLALLPIARSVALFFVNRDLVMESGEVAFLSGAVQCFSWCLHLMYSYLLYHRLSISVRGPSVILWSWFLCLAVNVIQARTAIRDSKILNMDEDKIIFCSAIINLIAQGIYILTLIPSGDQRSSNYEELGASGEPRENDSLLAEPFSNNYRQRMAMSHSAYGGFREDSDPFYLGVAKDKNKVNFLSKLFFAWVNPLIVKGQKGNLHSTDDLFDLPEPLTVHQVGVRFQSKWEEEEKIHLGAVKLWRILYNSFGKEFFLIGILKLIGDVAGFAGPILLNLVVTFVEQNQEDVCNGYGYSVLLALSAFIAALSNCHFNLCMNELGIKVRGGVSCCVYKKLLQVSKCKLSTFNSGQIINFMSTDVDRIVNFSPSLHAFWSLPFQFGVTLYLLYQQVGVSFLAGLLFTILVIPVNKFIANKIGDLSTKMMQAKDNRVNVMSELVAGIRVIKYFNWQKFFTNNINQHRTKELKYLQGRKYLDALCVYLWATTPVVISVLTFVTYVLLGNTLTAAKVFTCVALFAMLTGPLNAFPWVLNGLIESLVSFKRLDAFLDLEDFNPDEYFSRIYAVGDTNFYDEEYKAISLVNVSATHNTESENIFKLENLCMSIMVGEYVGITGKVGSGKTSLLELIVGELERIQGSIAVDKPSDGIGYVTQEPWLLEGNIRDNILFGTAYQHSWYSRVVEACALKDDFEHLPQGDMTNVGDKGSKMSGGQKARISLARAIYQNKKIYLIDDIFSAVDPHVAIHIYRKCIIGLLGDKTRILCTHQTRYLSGADTVVRLKDGKIMDQGPASVILPKIVSKESKVCSNNFSILGTPVETGRNSPTREPNNSGEGRKNSNGKRAKKPTELLANTELNEQGTVKLKVYVKYFRAVGSLLSPMILISMIAMQFTRNLTDVWLAHWVSDQANSTSPNTSDNHFNSYQYQDELSGNGSSIDLHTKYYLEVYATIAVGNTFFTLIRAFLFAYGGICAAKKMHSKLLKIILRAKVMFFDNTPAGRILNRFSSDLYTVDDSLPFILNIFLANLFGVVGPVLVTVYAMPWILLILIPLTLVYNNVQYRYRPASRDLKRIGSVAMSPIYSHFSQTLSGVATIRAMNQSTRFIRENEDNIENSMKAGFASMAASQWLELRLQMIGCAVVAGVALIAVIQHNLSAANPGLVGLAISYALGITGKLSGLVSSFTETEKELVAVERCIQYLENIPVEKCFGSITSPYGWPSDGVLSLRNVHMRYQPHLARSLRGLNLSTKAGEKVGIVGRTGSGKTSIFQTLYRLVEIESGEIFIDNVNISQLELEELREHLAIIPQHPFLFSGTVRENLDPDQFYSDRQLIEAIRKSRLERCIARLGGLDYVITGMGSCFSAGQKQLLCLVRAVLSPAKIVLIDEATANVDAETDHQVQEVIQSCLADRTILMIAHRVDTVLGCDRVFVMEHGTVVESGHPNMLLQDSSSKFSQFVSSR